MALALMDVYRLRADYLEWSGGGPPRFDSEIESYVNDPERDGQLTDEEARNELKNWMESGITTPPVTTRVCTYHGNVQMDAVAEGKVEEYGAPYVPVTIENAEGLAIYCGGKTPRDSGPGIVVERQSDRWAFFIGQDAWNDHEIIVYAMDDGRMVVVENDSRRPEHLTFERDVPKPLPPEQWKYKEEVKC